MAISLGSLVVDLEANTSLFLRGMGRAQNSVDRLERNIKTQFRSINRTLQSFNFLVGGAAVTGLVRLVKGFTDNADATGKFAARIGSTVEGLSRLQFVAELSGVAIQTLNSSLQRQTRRVAEAAAGNTRYTDALTEIKTTTAELVGLAPDEVFLRIAKGMEGLETQSDRVRVAQDLWGREGISLLQIVNQGTEAIEAMLLRSDQLGSTLTEEAAQGAADFNDAISELSRVLNGLAQTTLPAVIGPLTTFVELLTLIVSQARVVGKAIDDFLITPLVNLANAFNAIAIDPFLELFAFFGGGTGGGIDADVQAWADAINDAADAINDANEALGGLSSTAESTDTEVERLVITIDKSTNPISAYIAALEKQRQSFAFVQEQIEELVAWYDRLTPTEQVQNAEFLAKEFRRLGVTIEDWADLMENAIDRINAAFVNMWVDMLSGAETSLESLKTLAISILAEIIHEFATKRIVASFSTGNFSGTGASFGALAGGVGVGTAASGGFGGTGANILGGAASGAALGAAIASIVPVLGTAVGAGIGGVLGGLIGVFGGGGESRSRPSLLFAANEQRDLTQPGIGIGTSSPFGPNINFELSRFGNQNQLSNQEVEDLLDRLRILSNVIVGIDDVLAGTLEESQITNIGSILTDLPPNVEQFSEAALSNFIRDRFSAVFSALGEDGLGDVFDEFAGGLQGDLLLQYATDISNIHALFFEGGRVFDDVGTVVETVTLLMSDFVTEGESMRDVLMRISEANAILAPLLPGGETSSGSRFNLSVLEGVGGDTARLAELVNTFFDTFFTDAENWTRLVGSIGELVNESLRNLGTTRERFAADFQDSISSQLLSPEDIIIWLNAAESIAALANAEEQLAAIRENEALEAARDLEVARQIEISAINEQINALNQHVSVINAEISAQEQLQDQIRSIITDIDSLFSGAIEDIQVGLLNEEGQFNFFKSIAESLAASLPSITDPELLRSVLTEIEQRVGQAFGTLDEQQQAIVGPEFIKFLEDVLTIGTNQLEQLSEETLTRQEELEARRDALLVELAGRLEEAALLQKQASSEFSNAVVQFGQAASQPREVQVIFQPSLVGA